MSFKLTDNKIIISQLIIIILWSLIDYFIKNGVINLNNSQLDFLLIVTFILAIILYHNWLNLKLTPDKNKYGSSKNLKRIKYFLISIILSISFITILILFFTSFFPLSTLRNLLIILSIILLSNIIFEIFIITKQPTRPSGYILKEFIKKIEVMSNDYTNTFSIKIIMIFFFVIIPLIIGIIYFQNLVIFIPIVFGIYISILVGSYWLGYGLFRSYRWIWGYENLFNNNNKGLTHSKLKISDKLRLIISKQFSPVIFGLFASFFLIILLIELIFRFFSLKNLYNIPYFDIVFIVFFIISAKFILQSIPNTNEKQPWYSLNLITFQFIVPVFWLLSIKSILKSNVNSTDIFYSIQTRIDFINFLTLLSIFGILVIFMSNNRFLMKLLWNDNYESTNFLMELNSSINDPKVVHLTLIHKFGEIQGDKEIITSLIGVYNQIIQQEYFLTNTIFQNSIQKFLLFQLEKTIDWDIHLLTFDLTHKFLDLCPHEARSYFDICIYNLKHLDSRVKYESINLIGHILQLSSDDELIDETYVQLENIYEKVEEKQRKLIIDAFSYFIINYELYRTKIFEFLIQRIEKEMFGVATYIFELFEKLIQIDPNSYQSSIYSQCIKELELDYSPAKLGVVKLIKNYFPYEYQFQQKFLTLLEDNLNDIDNPIGVRPNIIYAFGDIIEKYEIFKPILDKLKTFIDDPDPDVRSALIQTFAILFSKNLIDYKSLKEIMDIGLDDSDYIVRVIIQQSILSLVKEKINNFKLFQNIIIKGLVDESLHVKEAIINILELFSNKSDELKEQLMNNEKFSSILNDEGFVTFKSRLIRIFK